MNAPRCRVCGEKHHAAICPSLRDVVHTRFDVTPSAPESRSGSDRSDAASTGALPSKGLAAVGTQSSRKELFRKLGRKRWEGKTDAEKLAHSEMMIRKLQEKLG